MNDLLLLYAPLFVFCGAIIAGLAFPLMQGRVAPNNTYGLRTEKTLANDTVWYAANRYGGKWLFGFGVIQVAVATLTLLLPAFRDNLFFYIGVNTMTLLIGTLTATLASVAYSEKL